MVMVPERHVYQRYISDLAGFDPKTDDGNAERVAVAVLAWLATRPTASAVVGPPQVLPKLSKYSDRKCQLDDHWGSNTPWGHVIELAVDVARS
jgi:hypothetical protein